MNDDFLNLNFQSLQGETVYLLNEVIHLMDQYENSDQKYREYQSKIQKQCNIIENSTEKIHPFLREALAESSKYLEILAKDLA